MVLAVAWLALTAGNPLPPRSIVMFTGPAGSAYAAFGERYREVLGRAGVTVRLQPTGGGLDNLQRLRAPRAGASVGFVESGLATRVNSPGLVSLGAVTLAPLWMFFREELHGTLTERLAGKRISIESAGSGTHVLVRRLLALNGVSDTLVTLLTWPPDSAATALLRGEIDGMITLSSWSSPAVQRLLAAQGVVLEGFPRADAYVALYPVLSKVVLPTGAADLARNTPPADVPLLAVEGNLVVPDDLHPALKYLLLEAAAEIHGGPDVFYRAGRFPGPGTMDLRLAAEAATFYRSGRPFVYRYLPLWLAALAERLLIVLVPLFAIVFPVLNIAPKVYAYLTERRIFGLYRDLRMVEALLERPGPLTSAPDVLAALDGLAHRANHMKVPLVYAQRLFIVKSHIALARAEVERRTAAATDQ